MEKHHVVAVATLSIVAAASYYFYKNVDRFKDTQRASKFRNLIPAAISALYPSTKVLGEGSFAVVFAGGLNNKFAIKVIPRQIMSNNGDLHEFSEEYLQKELDILHRVHHKNILNLVDSQWTKDALILVTENCRGGVLFDKIVEIGTYNEDVAKHIFIEMVNAVEYLHNVANVIHRDLKPENILLMNDGSIRICDFGVSKMWTKKQDSGMKEKSTKEKGTKQKKRSKRQGAFKKKSLRTSTVTGTPGYQAPEMQNGDSDYGTKVDMWSLGIILHAMLGGELPVCVPPQFASEDWNHVSQDAKDLITSLCDVDENVRPSASAVLESNWLQVNNEKGGRRKSRDGKEMWDIVKMKLKVVRAKGK